MTGELVRVSARDGLELVGFYAAPSGTRARRAVFHTHGLAGNFYENRLVSAVCEAVVAKGLAFLTLNNRGHEYRSDNLREAGEGTESVLGGASFDIFGECVHDIGGGADFLESRGHSEIYFEGHSLGTNKVVHYLTGDRDPRAAGAILISPPDMFGLRDESADGGLDHVVDRAKGLVAAGRGEELMNDIGYVVPFSAATVVSVYGDAAVTDIFPFRLGGSGDFGRYASLGVPVLATLGTVEEAITVPAGDALALLERKADASPEVRAVLIEGGNHVYWGHEEELARTIADFVRA
jgi:pimeloyl-ACP methyl ester carboxylesterase